jgi:hypothetical protein
MRGKTLCAAIKHHYRFDLYSVPLQAVKVQKKVVGKQVDMQTGVDGSKYL